jgi:hypothetical protein
MVAHSCNLNTQEAEVGRPKVGDQPGLLSKTLSQKIKRKKKRKYLPRV